MSLSTDQVTAFKTNSGFTPEQLGVFILSMLFAITLIWGVWAIKTAYTGWVNQDLTHKDFVMVVVRFGLIYCILTFLLLS
ncbi:MAG: TIGR03758 family integrating conjugative element protein [Saezia sp.]